MGHAAAPTSEIRPSGNKLETCSRERPLSFISAVVMAVDGKWGNRDLAKSNRKDHPLTQVVLTEFARGNV